MLANGAPMSSEGDARTVFTSHASTALRIARLVFPPAARTVPSSNEKCGALSGMQVGGSLRWKALPLPCRIPAGVGDAAFTRGFAETKKTRRRRPKQGILQPTTSIDRSCLHPMGCEVFFRCFTRLSCLLTKFTP